MYNITKVHTKYGKIKGTKRTTADGKDYNAFFGIPYAKQPSGLARFRDPEPLEPWPNVFDASGSQNIAYQPVFSDLSFLDAEPDVVGSDNCLVLNVYTPNVVAKLPVLVWIHGGGFLTGSNSIRFTGPDYFVEKDVIVVTINYRLSVFGFLRFKDPEVGIPGNAGLKDQSMALRWVKENIANFGGDSEKITLAGESSGACSVHMHLVSPMSRNLFNQAIMQSGSAFSPWAILPECENYEYDLARELGWNGEGGDKEVFDVISRTNTTKLILTAYHMRKEPINVAFGSTSSTPFLPRVEAYESKMCFLPKKPVELGRNAWSKGINMIIGSNETESFYFEKKFSQYAELLEKDFKLLIPNFIRPYLSPEEQEFAVETFKKLYFGEEPPNFKDLKTFLDMMADLQYDHGMHRFALQRNSHGSSGGKTYQYLLTTKIDPHLEVYKILRKLCAIPHLKGCAHGDELALIWKTMFSPKPTAANQIYKTFVRFFGAYVNFVKTGNPNNPNLGVKWKTIDDREEGEERFTCIKFSEEGVKCVPAVTGHRLLEWDKIYKKDGLI